MRQEKPKAEVDLVSTSLPNESGEEGRIKLSAQIREAEDADGH